MLIIRRFYARVAWKKDPGIANRQKLFPDIRETEDLDDLESDLMEVHKSHKEHVKELKLMQEREQYLIVKQKYFKEKYPNFLTWQDKEQIRYLHQTNPEEWTIEKLSEGFPALPEVIKKVIKGKWSKMSQHKIVNHDRTVEENWAKFKQNQDLPAELREHLTKFTDRKTQTTIAAVSLSKHRIEPKKGGDFSEIILSYQRLKEKKNPNEPLKNLPAPEVKEKTFTQEEVSKIVQKRHIQGDVNKVGFVQKTSKDVSHLVYPNKITIPPDLYQKGHTYKLNDCYYNSDGYFLYRVPGMV